MQVNNIIISNLEKALVNSSYLLELSLIKYYFQLDNMKKLLSIISNNTVLKKLALPINSYEYVDQIVSAFNHTTNIHTLSILCDNNGLLIDRLLMSNTKITVLYLIVIHGYSWRIPRNLDITYGLSHNKNLTHLYLNNCDITVKEAIKMTKGFKHNSSLISLDISNNYIYSLGTIAIIKALEYNKKKKLITLCLNNNRIDINEYNCSSILYNNYIHSGGISVIANSLKYNKIHLHNLHLDSNFITSNSAIKLAHALEYNHFLKILSLSKNNLNDKGGIAFAEMLIKNKTLIELDLSNCGLTIESLIKFKESIYTNTTLTKLNLNDNNINFAILEALTKGLQLNSTLIELKTHPYSDIHIFRLLHRNMIRGPILRERKILESIIQLRIDLDETLSKKNSTKIGRPNALPYLPIELWEHILSMNLTKEQETELIQMRRELRNK